MRKGCVRIPYDACILASFSCPALKMTKITQNQPKRDQKWVPFGDVFKAVIAIFGGPKNGPAFDGGHLRNSWWGEVGGPDPFHARI